MASFLYNYGEFLNPLDFYSNKNPSEYQEVLKYLENLLRNKFKSSPPDPAELSIFHNDSYEEEQNKDIYIDLPDIYKKQAVHKTLMVLLRYILKIRNIES